MGKKVSQIGDFFTPEKVVLVHKQRNKNKSRLDQILIECKNFFLFLGLGSKSASSCSS